MIYRTSTAIVFLTLVVIAWGCVALFAWTIHVDEGAYMVTVESAVRKTMTSASSARTHALVQETAKEASQLRTISDVDVVSAAYMIEAVGKAVGVTVRLGDAQPEDLSGPHGSTMKAVGFVVQAEGKFPSLMRAVELFETLPILSTVSRLDIERVPGVSSLWRMNVYIRVFTTSNISL